MTWKAFHNRGETLRSVIATAAVRRDGLLPMDVDGVGETFRDELDLLAALQLKWHTRLAGHIERQMLTQPMDLQERVALAWRSAAEELPGVRQILDHYREHPLDDEMARAMRKATAKEHQFLAIMAGRSGLASGRAVQIGAEIEEQARRLSSLGVTTLTPAEEEPRRPTLLERLRQVVAA